MDWSDQAIILSISRYNENAAIVRTLTKEHGLCGGAAHAAFSRKWRGLYQPGNIIHLQWRARLAEQLGSFSQAELLKPIPALIMQDATKMLALSTACILTESILAAHHPEPELFIAFSDFLNLLVSSEHWLADYIHYELTLLTIGGYGLDFSACAVTGSTQGLTHVSPRTGKAVTTEGAGEYIDQLLPLPAFLCNKHIAPSTQDFIAALKLTGFFIEKWVFAPHNKTLPAVRQRLFSNIAVPAEVH